MIVIFLVIVAIGIVIFVHELGHFIVAKKSGIKVEKFYLGLGPEIFGVTFGETRYGLAAIPIGGMVKLSGEEMKDEKPKEGDFFFQPWYRRIYVALAGSVMNLFLAVFLFFLAVFIWGIQKPSEEAMIGDLNENFPAYKSGIQKNDLVIKLDNTEIKNWKQMAEYIHARPEKNVRITVKRGEKELNFKMKTAKDPVNNIGLIGVTPSMITQKIGLLDSLKFGINQSILWNYMTVKYLLERIIKLQKPELSGPVGIIQIMSKTAKTGMDNFLFIVAIISNSLALFNLFPIPLLDGGHIFLFVMEGILKRPLDKKFVEKVNIIGLAIIISIFLFATYSDLVRISVGPK